MCQTIIEMGLSSSDIRSMVWSHWFTNALQRCSSLIFVNNRISNTGKMGRKVSKCLKTIDWSHIQVEQGNFHLKILEMEILCEIFGWLHSLEEYKFYFYNLRRPFLMANMAKKLFLWKLDVKERNCSWVIRSTWWLSKSCTNLLLLLLCISSWICYHFIECDWWSQLQTISCRRHRVLHYWRIQRD